MNNLQTMKNKPPSSLKILFADYEEELQEIMKDELPCMGHEVTVCPDGATAIAALDVNTYDCILVDLDMPGMSGLDVIERCKAVSPDTEAIVLTGKSSLESAVKALRFGAFDYLTKPCKLVALEALLQRVADKRELTNKYRAVKRRLEHVEGGTRLLGESTLMQRVRAMIDKVAPTNATVLIQGETGVGKELVARSLHEKSLRHEGPFVAINCGALPESLIESELFGHRKGAFTGADEQRQGLFEMAQGGTVFLDEIAELPKAMQAKLLRVLEDGEVRRVGDSDSFQVDVRVVCATHRNLKQMVDDGDFRQDLMYRVNAIEIHTPPLRDRTEDIAELSQHLCRRFAASPHNGAQCVSPRAIERLQAYDWPGNVRELANVLEHASIFCEQFPITADDLPPQFRAQLASGNVARSRGPISLKDLELQAIHEAIERHNGSKPLAAKELGISLKTLYNRLNQELTSSKSA